MKSNACDWCFNLFEEDEKRRNISGDIVCEECYENHLDDLRYQKAGEDPATEAIENKYRQLKEESL